MIPPHSRRTRYHVRMKANRGQVNSDREEVVEIRLLTIGYRPIRETVMISRVQLVHLWWTGNNWQYNFIPSDQRSKFAIDDYESKPNHTSHQSFLTMICLTSSAASLLSYISLRMSTCYFLYQYIVYTQYLFTIMR